MALTFDGSTNTISGLVINSTNITDGSIVNADISASAAIASTKLSGVTSGITMADQWRVTSGFDSNNTDITNNWERVDTGGFGQIGTGMTESSGIFTFPSTGIYRIDFQGMAARGANDSIRFVNLNIKTTTDNSNYGESSYGVTNIHNANNVYASAYLTHIFDVTDVSTHKVKFFVQSENTLTWLGSTNTTNTGVAFIRLGDT